MKKRKLLLILISAVLFCVTAILVLPFFVSIDSFRPRIETAASDALGMEVLIKGDMGISLLSGLNVFIKDVEIKNMETDVAFLEEVRARLKIRPLIRGEASIDNIEIRRPEIFVVRFKNGDLNIARSTGKTVKDEKPGPVAFAVGKIIISNGDIVYSDLEKGSVNKIKGLDIEINDLITGAAGKDNLLQDISFEGTVYTKNYSTHALDLSDIAFGINAGEGMYRIKPVSMTVFGGKAEGEITLDVTDKAPHLDARSIITGIRLEEFFKAFSKKSPLAGTVDFSFGLSLQGVSIDEAKSTVNGYYLLEGESLTLKKYDIDLLLDNYRKSQKFGALDIGAFFLAGPLGIALTKGYEFEEVYRESGAGEGTIRKAISNWRVENGVAMAEDVAFSTKENRLALKGSLDFVNGNYEDVIVAVTDWMGCAEFSQKINGPLDRPEFGKTTTNILKSVVGSVVSLINRTGKLISGRQCEAFYEGSVQYPQ